MSAFIQCLPSPSRSRSTFLPCTTSLTTTAPFQLIPTHIHSHPPRLRSACRPLQSVPRHVSLMTTNPPPINLPSALLLLSSSIFAIACVGCTFELSGGNPQYGVQTTMFILAVSLPAFLFLFYAAIRKGQQEALEDP